MIQKIDEGQTGLLLIAEEEDNRPLNQLVMFDLVAKSRGLIQRKSNKKLTMRTKLQMKRNNRGKQKNNTKKQHRKKNRSKDCFLNKGKQSFKILRNHGFLW